MFNSLEKEEKAKSNKYNFYMFDAWDFDRETSYNHLVNRNATEYREYFKMLQEVSDDGEITHARIVDFMKDKVTYYDAKLNIITLEEWQVLNNRHKIHFILGNSK